MSMPSVPIQSLLVACLLPLLLVAPTALGYGCKFGRSCLCNFLNSNRGDQWRSQLLRGVGTLGTELYVGTITVYGEKAEPIYTYGKEKPTVHVAAAEAGKGRVLAFGKEGYCDSFQQYMSSSRSVSRDYQSFWGNVLDWYAKEARTSKPKPDEVMDVSSRTYLSDSELKHAKVLVWSRVQEKSETFLGQVYRFVEGGGLVICGANPWYWHSIAGDMDTLAINQFIRKYGMTMMNDYKDTEFRSTRDNQAQEAHFIKLLDNAANDRPNLNFKALRDSIEAAGTFDSQMKSCIATGLQSAYNTIKGSTTVAPTYRTPIRTSKEKILSIFLEFSKRFSRDNSPLPGADSFPGVPSGYMRRVTAKLKIQAPMKDFYHTGYYAQPGQTVRIDAKGISSGDTWRVIIGAHTDDITQWRDEWKRWPNVAEFGKLTTSQRSISMRNIFGGGIYFESLTRDKMEMEVTMSNVVEAPYLNTGIRNPINMWQNTKNSKAPWADLVGEYVALTMPSIPARSLKDPLKIVNHFDRVMVEYHDLRGTKIRDYRRQWIVYDVQASVGYMHAGYPIVGGVLNDVRSAPSVNENFTSSLLVSGGNWGWYHELGHNMQINDWTMEHEGEITVNIFTLYAYETLHGKSSPHFPRREEITDRGMGFVKQNCRKPHKDMDAFGGLAIHMQLIDAFGWEAYKQVFREYDGLSDSEKPSDEQEKLDQWVLRFSKKVGFNIMPFYEFWCFRPSRNIESQLRNLSPWLPNNSITNSVSYKVRDIERKYRNLVRNGRKVNTQSGSMRIDRPVYSLPYVKRV